MARIVKAWSPAMVFVLLATMIVFIRVWIIPYAMVLWDESEFLLQTYWAVKLLQSHDWSIFFTHLYGQIQYAAAQYVLLAPILALTGFSVEKARIIQMIFPVITGIATYILGVTVGTALFPREKLLPKIIGLISVVFFITSPILLYLHTVILKESIAATWNVLAVLCYLAGRNTNRTRWYTITGILIAFSFLTKYPYAILILAALGIEGTIALFTAKNNTIRIHTIAGHLLIVMPVVIAALMWVATTPERLNRFFAVIANNDLPNLMGGWDTLTYLFFYPRSIVYIYGVTLLVGLVLFVSWIVAVSYIRTLETRVLWIAFTTNVAFLTTNFKNVQDRYLSPIAPFLFVLAACVLVDLVRRSSHSSRLIRAGIAIPVAILIIHSIVSLPNLPTRVYAAGIKTMLAVAFNQLDANASWFNYDTDSWGKLPPSLSKEKPGDIMDWILAHVDLTKPVTFRGRFTELPPPYVLLSLSLARDQGLTGKPLPYRETFIGFTVLPASRYYTREYRIFNEWLQREVHALGDDPNLVPLDTQLFAELGIQVSIYGKP